MPKISPPYTVKAGVVQHGDAVGAANGQVLDVQALDRVHGFGALDVQFHFFAHHHGGQGWLRQRP